jgi:hypothetical protein
MLTWITKNLKFKITRENHTEVDYYNKKEGAVQIYQI